VRGTDAVQDQNRLNFGQNYDLYDVNDLYDGADRCASTVSPNIRL